MKQVQLKIEEFRNKIAIDHWFNPEKKPRFHFLDIFFGIIGQFIDLEIEVYENALFLFEAKAGISRETIIQALWEYQKSLLPTGYMLGELYQYMVNIDDFNYAYVTNFYNPETRIITITNFEFEEGER